MCMALQTVLQWLFGSIEAVVRNILCEIFNSLGSELVLVFLNLW